MKVNLAARKYCSSQRCMSSFFFTSKVNNEAGEKAVCFRGHAVVYILKGDQLRTHFLSLFTTKWKPDMTTEFWLRKARLIRYALKPVISTSFFPLFFFFLGAERSKLLSNFRHNLALRTFYVHYTGTSHENSNEKQNNSRKFWNAPCCC